MGFGSESRTDLMRRSQQCGLWQNVASNFRDVLIGHEAGSPIYDGLNFIVTIPNQRKEVRLHKSVFTASAGLVLPFSVRFSAGQTKEPEFPLNRHHFAGCRIEHPTAGHSLRS
jgi:hypothetical protein